MATSFGVAPPDLKVQGFMGLEHGFGERAVDALLHMNRRVV